ncbi:MAG: MATE family efflux transporter [Erythrobacter sp.]
MSETAKLASGSIRGHLVSQTLPMVIGVSAIMSIGLVDSYFIGQLGKDELAAIAFVFPIAMAMGSLGVGMMVGINSIVARALGEGDQDKAARRANLGFVTAIIFGIVAGLLIFALVDPLFALLQAPDHLRPIIATYMRPFALGFPLQLAIMGLNGMLRGQGEARRTSYISLTYAAGNWVLDPILITGVFGFGGFGIAGAAYASLIGWAMGIAVGLLLIRKTALPLNPTLLREGNLREPMTAMVRVAAPAAFSNSINPVGLSILTALIAVQGAEAVAGFGAAGRVQSFALVPLLALSGSIGGIVGQNWGANKPERSREALFYAGIFCVAYGLLIACVLAFGGWWFADFFTDDPAVMEQFATYLGIAAWGYAGFGLLIVANGALNAIDRASFAFGQSAARVFLIMLPAAWLLQTQIGANGIYAAELIANVVGGAFAAVIAWKLLNRDPAQPSVSR